MALTNDEELRRRLILHRSHGITSTADYMQKTPSNEIWNYQQISLGYNYRMTDIAAGLGISQLSRLDSFVSTRHDIAERYNKELLSMPIKLPKVIKESYSSYHLYVNRLKLEEINKTHQQIHDELIELGVMVNLHYIPVYRQPYYEELGFKKGYCPESEKYHREALSIPIHPSLKTEDQTKVIDLLGDVIS